MYTNIPSVLQKNSTCAQSGFKSRSTFLNLFNKYGIHRLQSISLFSWGEKKEYFFKDLITLYYNIFTLNNYFEM